MYRGTKLFFVFSLHICVHLYTYIYIFIYISVSIIYTFATLAFTLLKTYHDWHSRRLATRPTVNDNFLSSLGTWHPSVYPHVESIPTVRRVRTLLFVYNCTSIHAHHTLPEGKNDEATRPFQKKNAVMRPKACSSRRGPSQTRKQADTEQECRLDSLVKLGAKITLAANDGKTFPRGARKTRAPIAWPF